MACYDDEIFGPVLGVVRVDTLRRGAARSINDNPYGNGTAIFTRDGGAARQFQFDVQVGMVGVNVPDPGAGQLLQLRRLEGVSCSATPTCTARRASTSTPGPRSSRSRWPDPATSAVDLGFPQDRAEDRDGLRRRPADHAARVARRRAGASRPSCYGFSHVWTFDSHILWQEPYVIYSQILAATRKVDGRADGDQPGHPRLDGHGVAVRHAQRDVRQPHRLRHRPRRLGGAGHQRQADHAGHAARVDRTSSASWPTAASVDYKGSTLRFPWAAESRLEVWVAAYGPKALALTGEVGDGFILQLADPDIAAWTIKAVRDGGRGAPGATRPTVTICVAAPAYVGDDLAHAARPVPLVRRHGRQPRRRHRRPLRRRRRGACPRRSPTTSRAARATTTTSTARPATPTPTFVPDEIVDRFCLLGPVERARRAAARAEGRSASTSSPSTCSTTPRTTTLARLRRARHARRRRPGGRPSPSDASQPMTRRVRRALLVARRAALWSRCGRATRRSARRRTTRIGLRRCRPAPTTCRCPTCGTMLSRFGDPELPRVEPHRSGSVVLEGMLVHVPRGHGRVRRSASPSASASPS